ncbi:hypothetical protein QT987_01020 [Microcoleus sp. SVA1B4]
MVLTEILHHSQLAFCEQARCLFHKELISCGTGILPVPDNGARCEF